MASKAITVKVPTAKVITALQAKLEKIELDFASQESNDAQYQNAMEAWRKEIGKWAIDRFSKASNIRTNYREWNKTLNVDFDITVDEKEFPKEPVREHDKIHLHEYKEMVEDITNALSILRMTDEEVVNASTMKSIARYL
jgi:hypothetical protein